ncbi:hypothetical protein TIFTF001_034412 [Ficus carica]|uniref:Uncharacterized protein n=1 Tax=Ficus carica TaxID=3494 RepID=A0AA88E2Q9_FICCA|nr:hypothetical protein TIFTF001_034412 [Ficus carica]
MMMRISKSTELYIADFTDNIMRLMSQLKKTEHSRANFTGYSTTSVSFAKEIAEYMYEKMIVKLNIFHVKITESERIAWSGLLN